MKPTPDARRSAALRRDPGKHRCACGAPAVKYKCGSYACARCDAMEVQRAGGKSPRSRVFAEPRAPSNRCNCPASYDHTILGHLPDCQTHDDDNDHRVIHVLFRADKKQKTKP